MRVSAHLGIGQDEPTPAGPPPIQKVYEDNVKALHASLMSLVTQNDELTAVEVLNNILEIDKQSVAIEKTVAADPRGNKGLLNRLRTIRFKASRIAVHLFRSLTPDGREANRILVGLILDYTPDLRNGHRREHFAGDDELRRFAYPKGSLDHGRKLGLEKKRLGVTESEFGRRQAALAQRRAEARRQGKVVTEGEASNITESPAPAPGTTVAPTPSQKVTAAVNDQKRRNLSGWYGMGYFGQETVTPVVENYLAQKEKEFRSGSADVEKQAEILDKVADLNEAANAGLSPDDAINAAEGGGITTALVVVGGVAVVGIILYLLFKKG